MGRQWKMVFNSDPTKQAQEVIFSRKSHSPKHHDLYFNSLVIEKMKTQKHLGFKLKSVSKKLAVRTVLFVAPFVFMLCK